MKGMRVSNYTHDCNFLLLYLFKIALGSLLVKQPTKKMNETKTVEKEKS